MRIDPLLVKYPIRIREVTLGVILFISFLFYAFPKFLGESAKTAATLDVVSGGRLTLGVGVGVIEDELIAMGSPFSERGAITDETIAIMKELWTQEDPSYQGRFHSFSGMKFTPKPVQKPHIPIIIGGTSRAAVRRAAKMGDGWHPTALDPENLSQLIRYLGDRAQAEGRDPSEIAVSVSAPMGEAGREGRYSLGSDAAEILQKAKTYEAMGVDRLVISSNTRDSSKLIPALEMLAERVLPSFK